MANPMNHHRLLNQQILQLPHKQDGTINYAVLGNMLMASILGEMLEVSFVDQEYGKPKDQLLNDSESNWEFLYKENDVTVFKKKRRNSKLHSFLGRGVIDVPMSKIVDYIHKFHSRLEWDDFAIQVEVCKCMSENDWLYYMAHEAHQCLFTSKRDFFVYCRTGYVDNKYIQTSISIEDKDYPHRPSYIRGEIIEGSGWVIEKNKDSECSSLVTYVANLDLKELPAGVMDRVLKRQPMAIHHIRQKLTKQGMLFQSRTSSMTSESRNYSLPELAKADMFEDSAPISHYTNRDGVINESVEIDQDTPMYPWVTADKKVREKKRLAKIQQMKGDERTNSDCHERDTSSNTSMDTKMRSNSCSGRSNSTSDESNADQSKNTIDKGNEQVDNTTTRGDFPSFSSWSKE